MKEQLAYFKLPNVTTGIQILPFGNLARKRKRSGSSAIGELSFQMRPPMKEALEVFFP